MSDFEYHLDRIKNAGYGWARLGSSSFDPIRYANKIGLDVIVVLDIRAAFREFYQAQGEARRQKAHRFAEQIREDARRRMKIAQEWLEGLLHDTNPVNALIIEAARRAARSAEKAFDQASMRADQMITDADQEYQKFLLQKIDIVSRLDESAFPPGWEGIWESYIKKSIDDLRDKGALVHRYQITNEPNHPYHNWALSRNLDLAAKVVQMGSQAAKARHLQLWGKIPETMVNLFFRWCNADGLIKNGSYIIDDRSYIEKFCSSAFSIDTLLFDIYPLTWHILTLDDQQPILPGRLNRYLDEYHDHWQDQNGDSKPVGIMETGWCTAPHPWLRTLAAGYPELHQSLEDLGIPLDGGDLAQAEFFRCLFHGLRDYLANRDWVKYLGVYEYESTEEWHEDMPGLPCENYFGLVTRYGRDKPAWRGVAEQIARLKGDAQKKVGITYHI